MFSTRRLVFPVIVAGLLCAPSRGWSYPLDGFANTGIARVEAFRIAQKNTGGKLLPPGANLTTDKIVLSLQHLPDFEIPPPDPVLSRELREELGSDARGYGVALLDISDPMQPRYAEVNPYAMMNAGSVGKLLVGLGVFQTLADMQPDIGRRRGAALRAEGQFIRSTGVAVDLHSVGGAGGQVHIQPDRTRPAEVTVDAQPVAHDAIIQ